MNSLSFHNNSFPSLSGHVLFCASINYADRSLFDDSELHQVLGGFDESNLKDIDLDNAFLQEQPLQDGETPQTKDVNDISKPSDTLMSSACDDLEFSKKTSSDLSLTELLFKALETTSSDPIYHVEEQKEPEISPMSDPETVEKPKRSLTAYNLFFKDERERLLKILPISKATKSRKAHGKLGFAEMARTVAANWKKITPELKMEYERRSELDKERFEAEYLVYKKAQRALAKRKHDKNTNKAKSGSASPIGDHQATSYPPQTSSTQFDRSSQWGSSHTDKQAFYAFFQ